MSNAESNPDNTESNPENELIRVRVTYRWDSHLSDDGVARSRQRSVWHRPGPAGAEPALLAAGARRAALAYPKYVSRVSLGIVGVDRPGGPAGGPTLYVRPAGPALLRFGAIQIRRRPAGGPVDVAWPVVGGWLDAARPDRAGQASLGFRWWGGPGREIFETRLSGFKPAIRGRRRRAPIRAAVYRWTQTPLHSWTMYLFHRWLRRHRYELLWG